MSDEKSYVYGVYEREAEYSEYELVGLYRTEEGAMNKVNVLAIRRMADGLIWEHQQYMIDETDILWIEAKCGDFAIFIRKLEVKG